MDAIGNMVVATLYGLVGFRGVLFFFVILVGGWVCMGAYRVNPVCILNGTAKAPAGPTAAAG
jgi:hypothetical protein